MNISHSHFWKCIQLFAEEDNYLSCAISKQQSVHVQTRIELNPYKSLDKANLRQNKDFYMYNNKNVELFIKINL